MNNGPKCDYAEVNGLEMYYEIHGSGEPLILLHGGVGATEMFGGVHGYRHHMMYNPCTFEGGRSRANHNQPRRRTAGPSPEDHRRGGTNRPDPRGSTSADRTRERPSSGSARWQRGTVAS